jgi:hypothetical protein
MQWEKWTPSPRDNLIDQVRRGQITPDEAELEAEKQGFGPLATTPDPIDFDLEGMPWWSLPMALAWIAWRERKRVREHCAEYRNDWLIWVPGSWNVPTDDGAEFARIDGHELKAVGPSTACRLEMIETNLKSTGLLPPTTRMAVSQAEKQLFATLAAGQIVAVAKDVEGRIVDVPQREWPYLQLFEENQRDVLKFDPLDRDAAYSEIKIPRDELRRVWREYELEFLPYSPSTETAPRSHLNIQLRKGEIVSRYSGETSLGNPADAVPRQRAGRKPGYDWEDVELFVRRELNARGDFSDAGQVDDWKCQADLERSVAGYIEQISSRAPATSTIRENIGPMVNAWRSERGDRK